MRSDVALLVLGRARRSSSSLLVVVVVEPLAQLDEHHLALRVEAEADAGAPGRAGTAGSRSPASCTGGGGASRTSSGYSLAIWSRNGDGLGREQRHLLLLDEHGELRRLLARLEEELALPGRRRRRRRRGCRRRRARCSSLMATPPVRPRPLLPARARARAAAARSRVPGVVALHQRGAVRRELEHGDRRRRHDDALEQVEVHAGVVGDRRLDRVGVRDDDDELARVGGDDLFERDDHARLHLRDRLAAREPGTRRRALHASSRGRSSPGRRACRPSTRRSRPRARPGSGRTSSPWRGGDGLGRLRSCARSGSRTPRRSGARRGVRRTPWPGPARPPTGRSPARGPRAAGPSAR